jgi:hypothetical protein
MFKERIINHYTLKHIIMAIKGKQGLKSSFNTILPSERRLPSVSIDSTPRSPRPDLEKSSNLIMTISIISVIVLATLVFGLIIQNNVTTNSNVPKQIVDGNNKFCPGQEGIQRDWCYLDLAKKQRIDFCKNIFDDDLNKYCTGFIYKDEETCSKISNTLIKDACFISLAIEDNNRNLCVSTSKPAYCEKQVDLALTE